jgi:hypothetical protein
MTVNVQRSPGLSPALHQDQTLTHCAHATRSAAYLCLTHLLVAPEVLQRGDGVSACVCSVAQRAEVTIQPRPANLYERHCGGVAHDAGRIGVVPAISASAAIHDEGCASRAI